MLKKHKSVFFTLLYIELLFEIFSFINKSNVNQQQKTTKRFQKTPALNNMKTPVSKYDLVLNKCGYLNPSYSEQMKSY